MKSWTDLNIPKSLVETCQKELKSVYKDILDKEEKKLGIHDIGHAAHKDRKEVFDNADAEYEQKTGKTIEAPKTKKYQVAEAVSHMHDKRMQNAFEKNFQKMKKSLKGNQHKLDVDGDGEIESSDLRKLRTQARLRKLESRRIDEVSPEKLSDYIKAATVDAHGKSYRKGSRTALSPSGTSTEDLDNKIAKRHAGINKALRKLVSKTHNQEK